MNNSYNTFDHSYDDLNDYTSQNDRSNDSVYDQLADFDRRLCISALTKAAEISPLATECTIGPNSCIKKTESQIKMQKQEVDCKAKIEENVLQDKLQDDLRYTIIKKKNDKKLQENSNKLFNNLIEKMITNRLEVMNKYLKRQSEEYEKRTLEQRKHKLLLLKELRENDNHSVLEKSKLDEQHRLILNKHIGESINKILEEQANANAQFASIIQNHTNICISYNELVQILQTEPLAKSICDKYMNSMKTVIENTNLIMEFYKTRAVSEKEVKQLEVLSSNIQNIKIKVTEELQSLKEHQEMVNKEKELERLKEIKLQKELELKKEQECREAEAIKQAERAMLSKPVFYSTSNYEKYLQLQNFLEEYENQYKDLVQNPNLKKYRFDCQKAVNTPVNALSSVSGMHMKDKYDKLSKLLKGEKVSVLDITVSAAQYPKGIYYCTALLAKKIVRQGDLLVSSNPEAAFPLAAVAVALWSQFPDFGKLLEAYFQKHCPYLVPMFLPQKEGQTDKEFYISRGYTYSDEGVVEKHDKFLKRMSGIFRLYCAIWIARIPRFLTSSNPHGLKYGWKWLASFVNLRPEPDICATLLHDFIIVCGSEFFRCYGKQFRKLLQLISTEYLKILEHIDEGGPKSRLEVFLQNVIKTNHIPPPSGLLKPNTW